MKLLAASLESSPWFWLLRANTQFLLVSVRGSFSLFVWCISNQEILTFSIHLPHQHQTRPSVPIPCHFLTKTLNLISNKNPLSFRSFSQHIFPYCGERGRLLNGVKKNLKDSAQCDSPPVNQWSQHWFGSKHGVNKRKSSIFRRSSGITFFIFNSSRTPNCPSNDVQFQILKDLFLTRYSEQDQTLF